MIILFLSIEFLLIWRESSEYGVLFCPHRTCVLMWEEKQKTNHEDIWYSNDRVQARHFTPAICLAVCLDNLDTPYFTFYNSELQ